MSLSRRYQAACLLLATAACADAPTEPGRLYPLPASFGLAIGTVGVFIAQTDTDLSVEGILGTQGYVEPVHQNTGAGLLTVNARDVAIQEVTFDHLQLLLQKATLPAAGELGYYLGVAPAIVTPIAP